MKQVGLSTHLATSAIQGRKTVAGTGSTGSGTGAVKREAPAPKPQVTGPTKSFNDGVETIRRPDGSSQSKAVSGVESSVQPNGAQSISLPGAEKLRIDGDKVEIASGEGKDALFVTNEEGIQLARYTDKAGNTVQVDPETLTYEVFNKNTHQVIYPDGEQAVLVTGTQIGEDNKAKPYQLVAAFDATGQLKSEESSPGMRTKKGKLQFDLEKGPAERSLLRPLPGQPMESTEVKKTEAPAAQQSAAPVALLAEEPVLASEVDPTSAAKAAEAAVKAERKERLDALRKVGPDFFNPEKSAGEAQFQSTPSGVIKRMDEDSVAFSLPTGDQFRTDGDVVAVLGENPRAKNARLVTEDDGRTLLAFSDKARNSYQLDVNSGDFQVSNADGTLQQKLFADGRESISATSTHTTEAGTVRTSTHGALIEPDGTVARKEGFSDLQMDEKSLVYTLPNGRTTVRNLLMPTKGRHSEEKPVEVSPGVAEGWGDTQSMVDSILGKTTPAAASVGKTSTSEAKASGPVDSNPFAQEAVMPSGISRKTLPNGDVQTRLPSGVTFFDGEKPSAKGPDGEPLEVLKREVPSEGGYILYAKSKEGIGYTIAPEHLDFIAEGKDGKVHQLVKSDNKILTSISDGQNKHVHQFDGQTMHHNGSPGVYADVRTPNMIYVADQPNNRAYELPHAYPTPPGAPQPYGPGGPEMGAPGVQPSFWDKCKAFFTGQEAGDVAASRVNRGAHHGCPSHIGGMPGSCHQYDPMTQQVRQMENMNKAMMTMNMVGLGVTMFSTMAMPGLFFGGMYY